jgi:hypothetical protein
MGTIIETIDKRGSAEETSEIYLARGKPCKIQPGESGCWDRPRGKWGSQVSHKTSRSVCQPAPDTLAFAQTALHAPDSIGVHAPRPEAFPAVIIRCRRNGRWPQSDAHSAEKAVEECGPEAENPAKRDGRASERCA